MLVLDLFKATFKEFFGDDAPRLAAALSYYTIFSLPPLMILITMAAGLIWDPADVQGTLAREIGGAIGPEGAEQIRTMIRSAEDTGDRGTLMTILSIGALIFGATGAFGQLQAALNKAWDVKRSDDGGGLLRIVMKRVLSFGMILVIGFLLLVSLALSAALSAAGTSISGFLPSPLGTATLWLVDVGLSLVVVTLLFMAMYRVLPDARIAWSDVSRGAFATAVLFVAGKFLLGLYIARTDPGNAYGAAGSLAVVLVWVYYSAMIFFLGAEFTQVYADRRGSGIHPEAHAVRVGEASSREPRTA